MANALRTSRSRSQYSSPSLERVVRGVPTLFFSTRDTCFTKFFATPYDKQISNLCPSVQVQRVG